MGAVLLVEDDTDIREGIAESLREEGYEVVTATNGLEGLARAHERPDYGLVLLDLMMPVMDGWECCRKLRKDPELSRLPVILLSATGALESERRLLGAAGVLRKPIRLEELHAVVAQHCGPGQPP